MSWRTPLARAEGLGSSKDGVGHWWTQRITSVALIILGVWFVVSLLALPGLDYQTVAAWMRQGWTAPMLILFVVVSCWHSQLGVRVVIEDYVHEVGMKTIALALASFAHVIVAVVGVYAVLRVALGVPL
ncbi:MAG: succinate dehydrogenase, hydrophobic membrane anchor protein [Steroidobacteraceae bacterium]